MDSSPLPSRPPITDSPWLWAYLFCTAGLVALFLAGPKFGPRQAQIERQFEARERAWQIERGLPPKSHESTADNTIISLFPLYVALGAALAVAWIGLWWRHFARRGLTPFAQSAEQNGSVPFPASHETNTPSSQEPAAPTSSEPAP